MFSLQVFPTSSKKHSNWAIIARMLYRSKRVSFEQPQTQSRPSKFTLGSWCNWVYAYSISMLLMMLEEYLKRAQTRLNWDHSNVSALSSIINRLHWLSYSLIYSCLALIQYKPFAFVAQWIFHGIISSIYPKLAIYRCEKSSIRLI